MQRFTKRSSLSRVEQHGSWLLGGAAVVAWGLAVWQADHETVAAAWVVAGFVLLIAAAFFSRVIEVTREGVKLRDVFDAIDEVIEDAEVTPGDTTDEVKAKWREGVRGKLFGDQDWYDAYLDELAKNPVRDPSHRAMLLSSIHRHAQLVSTFKRWLESGGWEVQEELPKGRYRVDLLAIKPDGTRLYAEVRSAVQMLARKDAVVIANSPALPSEDARRAIVLSKEVDVFADARRVLLEAGLEVFLVDAEAGTVESARWKRPPPAQSAPN